MRESNKPAEKQQQKHLHGANLSFKNQVETQVKFLKFCVTNGTDKARVFYSLDNRTDRRACVTIYARDYGHALGRIVGDSYINDTDSMADYFDQGRVVLFEGHPLYPAARERAEAVAADRAAKFATRH